MSHGTVMEILAKKGTQPNENWGKILKDDMKLDGKEDDNKVKMKKDVLKNAVKKAKKE